MLLELNNFGLGFLMETKKLFTALTLNVLRDGKQIKGYYGLPYYNLHYGDVQLIMHAVPGKDGKKQELKAFNTHAAGRADWYVNLYMTKLNPDGTDKLSKRVIVSNPDGKGGMAVVNIVNADVLPSFVRGDEVRLQMIALPVRIRYYSDEDEYVNDPYGFRAGDKPLRDGAICPAGIIINKMQNTEDKKVGNVNIVRGTVRRVEGGTFRISGEEYHPYIVSTIDTLFGPLEVVHTLEQVDEAYRDNIREGTTAVFYGPISGDAAIWEYANGIVRDEEHALAVLRYVFHGGDPERLRLLLNEYSQYYKEYNGECYSGPDEIIDHMKYVQTHRTLPYFVHFATISSIDEGELLDYGVGTRCLVLAAGMPFDYESVAFVDVDDDGTISRIATTNNPRYHFRVEKKRFVKPSFTDIFIPESVEENCAAKGESDSDGADKSTEDTGLGAEEVSDTGGGSGGDIPDTGRGRSEDDGNDKVPGAERESNRAGYSERDVENNESEAERIERLMREGTEALIERAKSGKPLTPFEQQARMIRVYRLPGKKKDTTAEQRDNGAI